MINFKKVSLSIVMAAPLLLGGCEAYVVGNDGYYRDDLGVGVGVGYYGPDIIIDGGRGFGHGGHGYYHRGRHHGGFGGGHHRGHHR